jgi:hypothetical protein
MEGFTLMERYSTQKSLPLAGHLRSTTSAQSWPWHWKHFTSQKHPDVTKVLQLMIITAIIITEHRTSKDASFAHSKALFNEQEKKNGVSLLFLFQEAI